MQLGRKLAEIGIDLIDVSSAGVVPGVSIPVGYGYQTGLAETIRRDAGVKMER